MLQPPQQRLYATLLAEHLAHQRQMAFLSGPRQVGKTTVARSLAGPYLNWDNLDHRRLILRGPGAVAERIGLDRLATRKTVVVFDELHKYPRFSMRDRQPVRRGRLLSSEPSRVNQSQLSLFSPWTRRKCRKLWVTSTASSALA
jgi:hypothetical protein